MECCSICQKGNAPGFALCGTCMDALCHLNSRRYGWYQAAVRRALFPPKEGPQLPLSLPPVSLPAILKPESCLLRISES